MDDLENHGNKIEELPDGGLRITKPDGSTIEVDKDGKIQVDLSSIKNVGFENIFDLKSHVIMREGEYTIHKAEYHNGGSVRIAFSSNGKIHEFSCTNVSQSITKDNSIIISCNDEE